MAKPPWRIGDADDDALAAELVGGRRPAQGAEARVDRHARRRGVEAPDERVVVGVGALEVVGVGLADDRRLNGGFEVIVGGWLVDLRLDVDREGLGDEAAAAVVDADRRRRSRRAGPRVGFQVTRPVFGSMVMPPGWVVSEYASLSPSGSVAMTWYT